MEDILLILLGILWAAASYYQSQQKKKKQQEKRRAASSDSFEDSGHSSGEHHAKAESEDSDFLDQVFGSLDSGQDDSYISFAQEMQQREHPKDLSGPKDVKARNDTDKQPKSAETHRKEMPVEFPRKIRRQGQTGKQKWVKDIAKNFDGKRAVVYSEILNRPY
ncbi:MAG: hypothetical protein R6U19_04375 [Bacteroidales bacterium]